MPRINSVFAQRFVHTCIVHLTGHSLKTVGDVLIAVVDGLKGFRASVTLREANAAPNVFVGGDRPYNRTSQGPRFPPLAG
jgi:transposase-like protein